jgi:hypothetical protein
MSGLKTLRIRVDHLVLGFVGAALVVGGFLGWRALSTEEDQDAKIEQGLERVRAKGSSSASRATPRFARGYYSGAPAEGEGKVVFQPPPQFDPGEPGSAEAVDSFQQVIAELEDTLESGRKLGARERAEFYARATGSFTAMSAWVDPNEPSERAMMDDAYAQMMFLMRELKIQPPKHDTERFVRPE